MPFLDEQSVHFALLDVYIAVVGKDRFQGLVGIVAVGVLDHLTDIESWTGC